jgi:serine/threonine protein kinase
LIINERFEIKQELGRGGIGVVYLAEDCARNRELVVIKVLLEQPDSQVQHWLAQHFLNEAKALAKLDHPSIVKLIDAGVTADGKPFFAMEYIEGGNLRSQLHPHRGLIGDFERSAKIIRALGAALAAAHSAGIYHRDLKPENIMLEKPRSINAEERVVLIDFGIATVKDSPDEKTRTTEMAAGSILYMAPEQIESRPTAASDIYALGVIAYEMVTGRTPFLPESGMMAMVQLLKMQRAGVRVKPQDLRPSLPRRAQGIILKALAYHKEDRYQNAQEFGAALADALTDIVDESRESFKSTLVKPEQIVPPLAADNISTTVIFARFNNKKLIAAVSLAALLIAGAVAWPLLTDSANEHETANLPGAPAATTTAAVRASLTYRGSLQKYRGNRPVGAPINLTGGISGETFFDAADGLRFFVEPARNGFLYLINEEHRGAASRPIYNLIFPSAQANGGSARVQAAREVATSECIFDEQTGSEKVWIIWSPQPIAELDAAYVQWGNKQDGGEIKASATARYISELIDKYQNERLQVSADEKNERVIVNSNNEMLIYPIKLKHR